MRRIGSLLVLASLPACLTYVGSVAQPTALERQLLGEYERLDDELIWASSVRGASDAPLNFDTVKLQALTQRAIQRFNEDDVAELKREQCIEERDDAKLAARTCSMTDRDPAASRRIDRVVKEENQARQAIVLWAAHELSRKEGRATPTPQLVSEIRRTYAKLLGESARGAVDAVPAKP